jgi:hypothetical protein
LVPPASSPGQIMLMKPIAIRPARNSCRAGSERRSEGACANNVPNAGSGPCGGSCNRLLDDSNGERNGARKIPNGENARCNGCSRRPAPAGRAGSSRPPPESPSRSRAPPAHRSAQKGLAPPRPKASAEFYAFERPCTHSPEWEIRAAMRQTSAAPRLSTREYSLGTGSRAAGKAVVAVKPRNLREDAKSDAGGRKRGNFTPPGNVAAARFEFSASRQSWLFTAKFRATFQGRFINPKVIILQAISLNSVAIFMAYLCVLYVPRDRIWYVKIRNLSNTHLHTILYF